jgi:heat shock protein HslJ
MGAAGARRGRALCAVALASAGCAPVADAIPPQGASVEGRWQVVEIKRRATPASDLYRISFDNGQLGARFGCNHMGGRYRQSGAVIHAGDIASTLMGCPEPAATFERDGGAILAQPMSVSWTGRDRLELSNRAGGMKLVRIP